MDDKKIDLHALSLFSGDSYDTPPGRRSIFDRLILGNRLNFYLRNFNVFRRSGMLGKCGKLTGANQIICSNCNWQIVESCGGLFHIRGLQNLASLTRQPAVIIGNHMSLLETAIMHSMVREYCDFTFVIKESLYKVPFFRYIMQTMDAIPVTRTNPREDFKRVMERGLKHLAAGHTVIVFPQSTRNPVFKPEEFNTSGIKLARAANVPVVPLALKTDFVSTGRFLKDLGPLKRSEPIHFEFGEPLTVNGNGKAEHQQIIAFIESRLREWRKTDHA